ncbi:MAG: hypothetical protein AAFR28_17615 [Pseudomonadota bacterium]
MTLIDEARALARDQGFPQTPEGLVWALTVDAARTFASLPSAGPRGLPTRSCMPEPMPDRQEIFTVERDRIIEDICVATECRHQSGPRAIDRAYEVLRMWTPERVARVAKNPIAVKRALWMLALGAPHPRIREATGVPRGSLYRHKEKVCGSIAQFVF